MTSRIRLGIECALLFGGLPLVLTALQLAGGFPFLPVLFGFLGITLWVGWKDPQVQFRPGSRSPQLTLFACRILLAGAALMLLTAVLYPELLLRLPLQRPRLWIAILILYPLLSVAPQEYLYRTFFMQRYQPLFGNGAGMLWANALLFAWGHIFFLNWVAPLLSLAGGILLALTWQKTRSFLWVSIEHALYGQLVFTSGIGWWFYTGSAQSIQGITGG